MQHVYEVRMETLSKNTVKGKEVGKREWADEDKIWVLANGDAKKAVAKAERYYIGRTFTWEDDKGRENVNTTLRCRLISVEQKGSVEVT